jgi:hypothetical protein
VRPAVGPFPVAGREAGGWAVAGSWGDGCGGGSLFFLLLSGSAVAVLSIPLLFFLLFDD